MDFDLEEQQDSESEQDYKTSNGDWYESDYDLMMSDDKRDWYDRNKDEFNN